MKTQIFSHKGYLGIILPEEGNYAFNIASTELIGRISIFTENLEITQAAKDIIAAAPRRDRPISNEEVNPMFAFNFFGDDCDVHTLDIDCVMGQVCIGKAIELTMHTDLSVLDKCPVMEESQIPESFIEFIDYTIDWENEYELNAHEANESMREE